MPVSDIQEVTGLIDAGRAAEVVPTLEYLTGLFPTSATAHILLARGYEAEGAFAQALGAWQWAATLVPNSPAVQQGMARAIQGLASVPAQNAEPFPPGLVPPEVDDFVDLTEQPDMSPHFFDGPPVEETSATAPEFEDVEPHLTPPPEPLEDTAARRTPGRDVAVDDLDRLIAELESARITPDPDISAIPAFEVEDEDDDVVSETLARIYAAQRQYAEAARVYDRLAQQHPDRATEFMQTAAEMRERAEEG